MRGVIWIVLLFVVAVVAATTLGSNDGIVTLYGSGWRTDLSLNLFVIIVVAACFVLVSAAHALEALVSLPQRASEWRALRRERAAQAALRDAQAEFFSARYSRAHKAATKALAIQQESETLAGDLSFTVVAHLLAAGSLHRLQDRTRRDELVQQLLQLLKKGNGARGVEDGARLLALEWAVEDRDVPRAQEMLAELPPGVARRTQALRLKLQVSRLARDPLQALYTARLLANHQAFSPAAAQGLLRSLAFEVLDGAHDIQQLRRLWESLDTADRRDAHVAARAAVRAVALGQAEDGRRWLQPYWDRLGELDREAREQVALALMEAAPGIGSDWLPRLEGALSAFGSEPAVVAAIGAAFADRQLWGKARRLLEQAGSSVSLAGRARRQSWRFLAAMAREEGDDPRAQECERAAAAID